MTGIAASALGATIVSGTSSVTSNSNQSNGINFELFSQPNGGRLLAVLLVSIGLWAIFTLIVGGAVRLGYARFNLNLADGKDAAFSDLFSQKDRLWDGFCMKFLQGLYIALWSLLLVIPGIVKTCSRFCFPVRKLASWISRCAASVSADKHNIVPFAVLVNIPGKKKSLNKRFVETSAFTKILNCSVDCAVV